MEATTQRTFDDIIIEYLDSILANIDRALLAISSNNSTTPTIAAIREKFERLEDSVVDILLELAYEETNTVSPQQNGDEEN